MDHSQATASGAAERYALGEMSEAERDQYEEHYFDCPECAEEVKTTIVFRENAEALREDAPQSATGQERRRKDHEDPSPGWLPRLLDLFWPVPQGALAMAALLLVGLSVAAYQNLTVIPGLRAELRRAEGLQSASWSFLSVSRSEPPVLTVFPGQRMVGLTLSQSSDRPSPHYRCEVRDAQGRTLLSQVVPAPAAPGDELQILVPAAGLSPGPYVLVVTPLESPADPTGSEAAHYAFTLRHGERGEKR